MLKLLKDNQHKSQLM